MQPPVFDKFDHQNRDFKTIGIMLWIHFGLSFLLTLFLPYDVSSGTLGLVTVFATCITIWYGKKKTKVQLDRSLYQINFCMKDFGRSFVLMTGFSMAALLVITICSQFITIILKKDIPQALIRFDFSQFSSWIFLAYVCILGPIFEEIMFRGVILNTLARYNRIFAIIASSLIFGLFHVYLEQGAHAFVLGVILAVVTLKYNSMSFPILLHIFHNTLTTLSSLNETTAIIDVYFRLICMIIMFVWLSKNINTIKKEYKQDPVSYPFYARLFSRASFILWFILFVFETIASFLVI